jgi:hypothetical protein
LFCKKSNIASQAYDEGSIPFTRSSQYSNMVWRVSGCSEVRNCSCGALRDFQKDVVHMTFADDVITPVPNTFEEHVSHYLRTGHCDINAYVCWPGSDAIECMQRAQAALRSALVDAVRIPAMADTQSGDGGQRRSEATQVVGLSLRVSAMGVGGAVLA